MASTVPSFADIALQLETAGAQLRVLSTFPEAQREGKVMKAVEAVKKFIEKIEKIEIKIEDQAKKHDSEYQSLRDITNHRLLRVEAE